VSLRDITTRRRYCVITPYYRCDIVTRQRTERYTYVSHMYLHMYLYLSGAPPPSTHTHRHFAVHYRHERVFLCVPLKITSRLFIARAQRDAHHSTFPASSFGSPSHALRCTSWFCGNVRGCECIIWLKTYALVTAYIWKMKIHVSVLTKTWHEVA